jgi:hypothetical protein
VLQLVRPYPPRLLLYLLHELGRKLSGQITIPLQVECFLHHGKDDLKNNNNNRRIKFSARKAQNTQHNNNNKNLVEKLGRQEMRRKHVVGIDDRVREKDSIGITLIVARSMQVDQLQEQYGLCELAVPEFTMSSTRT